MLNCELAFRAVVSAVDETGAKYTFTHIAHQNGTEVELPPDTTSLEPDETTGGLLTTSPAGQLRIYASDGQLVVEEVTP